MRVWRQKAALEHEARFGESPECHQVLQSVSIFIWVPVIPSSVTSRNSLWAKIFSDTFSSSFVRWKIYDLEMMTNCLRFVFKELSLQLQESSITLDTQLSPVKSVSSDKFSALIVLRSLESCTSERAINVSCCNSTEQPESYCICPSRRVIAGKLWRPTSEQQCTHPVSERKVVGVCGQTECAQL